MKIKSVCIVGGGSAGWMTASWLAKHTPFLDITLIESAKTPIVGVGESTTMRFKTFIKGMEIDDKEFMPACDATYKTSIQFTDFRQIGDPPFQYPFGWQDYTGMENRQLKNNIWFLIKALKLKNLAPHTYAEWYHAHVHLLKAHKFDSNSELWGEVGFDGTCAYHFNTNKFGVWLKERYCDKVKHLVGDVDGFVTGDNNTVDYLKTSVGDVKADLYIDCTGFRSGLIGQFSKYIDFSPKLWVDKCIPVRIPYKDKNKQLTTVTDNCALGNGWVYTISNWNSIGSGYVYSSKHTSHENALSEYKEHIRKMGYDPEQLEFGKEITLRVGRHEKAWVGNVASIGLAYGFIEPLESNGLETVINNIQFLSQTLEMREGFVGRKFIETFNKKCNWFFDNFSDFINLHYYLSERDDTQFWRDITSTDFNLMNSSDEIGEAFNDQAFRSMYAVPNGTQYICAGMNVNPIVKIIYEASTKWKYKEDIEDLNKIIEFKENQTKKLLELIENIPTTPYEWHKEHIYNGVDDTDKDIDQSYKLWQIKNNSKS